MAVVHSTRGATGLVYDNRMKEHQCLWDDKMPECPERLSCIFKRCDELELISRCVPISARPATVDEVLSKHSQKIYDRLAATADQQDPAVLEEFCSHFHFIYMHPSTFRTSLLACGATIELLDSVLEGRCRNGMALVRPPGHHATHSHPNGWCNFNNVAVAAQRALDRGQAKRILIVDWDVHHGQGIQRAFYEDDRVLYFSVHRHENGITWPHLRESDFDYVGEGRGRGYNFNVPLNVVGMQNADYLAVWQQLLMPVALEFQPDLVIVAAGYDSALGCQLGEMELYPACYAHLLSPLMTLASGRVAVVLEGGYCLQSLAEGAALTLRTLLGDPCPQLVDSPSSVSASLQATVLNCIHVHRPFWRSLQVHGLYGTAELKFMNPDDKADKHVVQQQYVWKVPIPERYVTRNYYLKQSEEWQKRVAERLQSLEARTDLRVAIGGVGFVCDPAVVEHHPRIAESMDALNQRLRVAGLLPGRLHQAAGNVLDAMEGICRGHWRSAICAADGFSTSANVIAAVHGALRTYQSIRRVLVVDWDVRPGRDTRQIVESNRNVLYISVHRFGRGQSFPDWKDTGDNSVHVNIPWHGAGMGDAEYAMIFQRLIMPIAYEFGPDMVFVSAELDAVVSGGCRVTPEAFGHFTAWLAALGTGRMVLAIEGKYRVEPVARSVAMCAKALLGDPLPPLHLTGKVDGNGVEGGLVDVSALQALHRGWTVQAEHWDSLRGWNVRLPAPLEDTVGGDGGKKVTKQLDGAV